MARVKIDYGIDLGTTNSAIAVMSGGEPIIKKNEFQMDTTSSCVHFNKKKTIQVGQKAFNLLERERLLALKKNDSTLINAFEEFKRTMGTDEKYECANMKKSYSSEELSAEVLKALRTSIRDEDVNAIVITYPAKFQGYQVDATKKASELAGFQHCVLLQEPIAASMAYGVDIKNIDGSWLVFDFGGGTFDVALMRANEGIMKVIDTEGNNHLGGKNIDYAIVDGIIIPHIQEHYSVNQILENEGRKEQLRNAVKRFAEEAKVELSRKEKKQFDILTDESIGLDDDGTDIEINLTITKEKYEDVVKPIFQKSIDISQKLLKNNKLSGSDLKTILMIGGPTFSETLRDMLRDQITSNLNTSIDPMTAVAKGAGLFASTKNIPKSIIEKDKSKIQLKLHHPPDTVHPEETFGIEVNREESNDKVPKQLFVELNRSDKGWSSGRVEIKDDAIILDVQLELGKTNGFSIIITDEKGTVFPSEPDSFSIIQGFKVAGSTLPWNVSIEGSDSKTGKQRLININGLGKNQLLPAKGKGVYHSPKDIRPGKKTDQLRIPIYYNNEQGSRAIFNDLRGEIIITGDQLPGLLPKDSEVELSVDIDESQEIKVSVSFPYLEDEIIENVIKTSKRTTVSKDYLKKELANARNSLDRMEEEFPDLEIIEVEKIRSDINELEMLLNEGGSDKDTRNQIHDALRENLKAEDKIAETAELPKVMEDLKLAIESLENTNNQHGDENSTKIVMKISEQAKTIIDKKDIKMAQDLTEQIEMLDLAILDKSAGVALDIHMIKGFDDDFDSHDWKDRSQARSLINRAKNIISRSTPTREVLRPIIGELYSLLPAAGQGLGPPPAEDLVTT